MTDFEINLAHRESGASSTAVLEGTDVWERLNLFRRSLRRSVADGDAKGVVRLLDEGDWRFRLAGIRALSDRLRRESQT